MNKNLVTIIIPCFNAIKYTKQCLQSVLKHTLVPYELILINNGSTDGTKRYFNSLQKKLKTTQYLQKIQILQFKENLGVARSLNLGIEKSIGKYFCYLNNDVVVTKNWLKKMIKSSKKDKNIAAVGTLFNSYENKKILKDVENNVGLIDKIAEMISIVNKDKIKQANTIHGLCMFIKKSIFKKVGLFNENIYPCFGEDIEFCDRLKRDGYKLVDAMDVFIFHYWNKSVKSKEFTKKYSNINNVMNQHYDKFIISRNYRI